MILRSVPSRRIRAFPKGTSKSSGTIAAASTELYNAFGSRNKVKPLERILVRSSPAASSAKDGQTIRAPGKVVKAPSMF